MYFNNCRNRPNFGTLFKRYKCTASTKHKHDIRNSSRGCQCDRCSWLVRLVVNENNIPSLKPLGYKKDVKMWIFFAYLVEECNYVAENANFQTIVGLARTKSASPLFFKQPPKLQNTDVSLLSFLGFRESLTCIFHGFLFFYRF